MSVVCLVIRVLSIVRIFLGYPYFMAINSVNKTVVGCSSPPEQARLHIWHFVLFDEFLKKKQSLIFYSPWVVK